MRNGDREEAIACPSASAATSGRYAGRKAAEFARSAEQRSLDRRQVEEEKEHLYAPLEVKSRSMGWKELNAGICKAMQDYCGECRNEFTLKIGLELLRSLRESEATRIHASNPHELARAAECRSILTVGEMVVQASLARCASSAMLNFHRLDHPELDPPEWHKLIPIHKTGDEAAVGELPLDYHLQPPYTGSYEENYQKHCALPTGRGEERS